MGAGEMFCVFLVIVQTREDMVLIKRANPPDSKMLEQLRKELISDNVDYEELNRSTARPPPPPPPPPAPAPASSRFRTEDSFKQEPIHQHNRHFSRPPMYDKAHEPSVTTAQYPKMYLHRSTTQLQLYPTETPTEIIHFIHGKNSQGDNPLPLDPKRNENYFQQQQYPLQLQLRNNFVTRFPLIQQREILQEQLRNQPNQQQQREFHLLPQPIYRIQQKPKIKLQQQPNYKIQLSYSSDPLMQQQQYDPNQHQRQKQLLLQQQQKQGNNFLNRGKKFWQQNDQQPVNEHHNDQQSNELQKKQGQQRQQFILLQHELLLRKQKNQTEFLAQQQKFKGQKDLQEIQQMIGVQQSNVQHNATQKNYQHQITPQKVLLGQQKGSLQNKQQPNDEQQKYETKSDEQQGQQRQTDQQQYLPQQQKTLQQILLQQYQVALRNKQRPNDDLPIFETESDEQQDELPKNYDKPFFYRQQKAPLQTPKQPQKELQQNKQLNYEHQEDENQSNEQQSKLQPQAPLHVKRSHEQELKKQLPNDQPVNDRKKSHQSKENLSPRHHDSPRNQDAKYHAYRYIPTTRATTTTAVKTFQTNSLRPWKTSHARARARASHGSHHQYFTRVRVSMHTTARSFKGSKVSAKADLLETDSPEDDQSNQKQVKKDKQDDVDLEALLRSAVRRAEARAPPLPPGAPAHFLNASAALRRNHDYLRWKYSHGLF